MHLRIVPRLAAQPNVILARVRTAIISDLHLGVASDEDVLRDPAVRRILFEEIAGADRLVLLGDVVELRNLPIGPSLRRARPFFEELGEALGEARGRRSSPATTTTASPSRCSTSSRSPAAPPSGSSSATRPPPGRPPCSTSGWDRRSCRSPTPASGCARTSTPPTATTWTPTSRLPRAECVAAALMIRFAGPLPQPGDAGRLRTDPPPALRVRLWPGAGAADPAPAQRALRARLGGACRRRAGDDPRRPRRPRRLPAGDRRPQPPPPRRLRARRHHERRSSAAASKPLPRSPPASGSTTST